MAVVYGDYDIFLSAAITIFESLSAGDQQHHHQQLPEEHEGVLRLDGGYGLHCAVADEEDPSASAGAQPTKSKTETNQHRTFIGFFSVSETQRRIV